MSQQKGYILFMTFTTLALCTALASAFMAKGFMHKKLATALLAQDQLQEIALSTPALAQSFLYFSSQDVQGVSQEASADVAAEPASDKGAPSFAQKLLGKLLPVLNKTQKIDTKDVAKDFPVVISLTFFSESGKININGLYDLVNKKFYDEGVAGKDQKVFATWLFDKIAKITEKPSLLQPFIEHMKQRTSQLNDVTELLLIKEFADCFSQAVFYTSDQKNDKIDKQSGKLFLTDLFTVTSENVTIQPWLLSPSVCVLLDIAQSSGKVNEQQQEEKKIDLSSFKVQSEWQKDWDDGLKPLYGIAYDKVPESMQGMLATGFKVTVFSMLAKIAWENISVQIFAILKQKALPDGSIIYDVIKIYQV